MSTWVHKFGVASGAVPGSIIWSEHLTGAPFVDVVGDLSLLSTDPLDDSVCLVSGIQRTPGGAYIEFDRRVSITGTDLLIIPGEFFRVYQMRRETIPSSAGVVQAFIGGVLVAEIPSMPYAPFSVGTTESATFSSSTGSLSVIRNVKAKLLNFSNLDVRVQVRLWTRPYNGAWRVRGVLTLSANSPWDEESYNNLRLEEESDAKLEVFSAQTLGALNMTVSGTFSVEKMVNRMG